MNFIGKHENLSISNFDLVLEYCQLVLSLVRFFHHVVRLLGILLHKSSLASRVAALDSV
jgi:hypothetical protein